MAFMLIEYAHCSTYSPAALNTRHNPDHHLQKNCASELFIAQLLKLMHSCLRYSPYINMAFTNMAFTLQYTFPM